MTDITDEELARRVQGGESHWFALLVGRYEERISRYAKRFLFGASDIDDLVQEVFTKAFINIQSFDPERKFSPWIYRIAHNEFVNALKKRSREPLSFLDPDTLLPHGASDESSGRDEELKGLLEKGLKNLDSKYREPLILYYYEGMDYREISEVLRLPVSTVGVRLARGREALKKSMEKE